MLKVTCTSTMSLARLCTVANTFRWRSPRLVGDCTIQFHYFCFLRQPKGLPLLVRGRNTGNLRPVKGSVSCASGMGDVSLTTLVRCTLLDLLIVFCHTLTMAMAVRVFDSAGLAPWAAELYLVAFSFAFQYFFSSVMLFAFALLVRLTPPPPQMSQQTEREAGAFAPR